jgi:hypothetical protein
VSTLEKGPDPDQAAAEAAIFLSETTPEPPSRPPNIHEMVVLGKVTLMGAENSFGPMQQYRDALRASGEVAVRADPTDGSTYVFGTESDYEHVQEEVLNQTLRPEARE